MPSPADHLPPVASLEDCLEGWVHGWSVSRGTPPPVALPEGYRIDVGRPHHLVRYVLPTPQQQLIDQLHEPGTWLKTAGDLPTLSSQWTSEPPEYLMTTRLGTDAGVNRPSRPTADPSHSVHLTAKPDGLTQLTVEVDGTVAARGQVAVWHTFATFDQIVTEPAYRRRGLGSVVMRALSTAATQQGARTGVLVATDDGRALYTRLGWDLVSTLNVAWIEG